MGIKGDEMTKDEHIVRHKELHKSLDELIADFINNTQKLPSQTTLIELMRWSNQQTIDPEGDC